jgi:hypothetical protein
MLRSATYHLCRVAVKYIAYSRERNKYSIDNIVRRQETRKARIKVETKGGKEDVSPPNPRNQYLCFSSMLLYTTTHKRKVVHRIKNKVCWVPSETSAPTGYIRISSREKGQSQTRNYVDSCLIVWIEVSSLYPPQRILLDVYQPIHQGFQN